MKKTWIGLGLAALFCLPLAGCAGDKTGGDVTPEGTVRPTTQATASPTPNGGDNGVTDNNGGVAGDPITGTQEPVVDGDSNARMGTGRADNSALERVGDGIKDALDDMGNAARGMAQDAKRAME